MDKQAAALERLKRAVERRHPDYEEFAIDAVEGGVVVKGFVYNRDVPGVTHGAPVFLEEHLWNFDHDLLIRVGYAVLDQHRGDDRLVHRFGTHEAAVAFIRTCFDPDVLGGAEYSIQKFYTNRED